MIIKQLEKSDFKAWLEMGLLLWPHHSQSGLEEEFRNIFKSKNQETFLCKDGDTFAGFVNVSLRHEYVQGADVYPVGYLEGIFVREEYRGKKVGKMLAEEAEAWARSKGCKQMASDTAISNKESQEFHKSLGFMQDSIIVHFVKRI